MADVARYIRRIADPITRTVQNRERGSYAVCRRCGLAIHLTVSNPRWRHMLTNARRCPSGRADNGC